MAKRLGIPSQTWNNYEVGVTVPGVTILKVIELTSVEPRWLLNGQGARFQRAHTEAAERRRDGEYAPVESVRPADSPPAHERGTRPMSTPK